MSKIGSFLETYRKNISNIVANTLDRDGSNVKAGMSQAVGGNFDSIGYLEKCLLKQHGLSPNDFLIDVGCGSGRLLSQLSVTDLNRYLGTDISEELLAYSARFLADERWQLKRVDNCTIPADDTSADMVCMFSVITHLMHHESYLYFQEAARVLKSGGKLVVSFLEFRHPGLWPIFAASVENIPKDGTLDIFVDRDGLNLWASNSGLQLVHMQDGEKPHIAIDKTVRFDNGVEVDELARLGPVGQSVAVYRKV